LGCNFCSCCWILGVDVNSEFQHQPVDAGKDVHCDDSDGNGGVLGRVAQAGKILVSVLEGLGLGGSSSGRPIFDIVEVGNFPTSWKWVIDYLSQSRPSS